jgi:ATPase subunit of ABC transporter with duplicated ATPase domains
LLLQQPDLLVLDEPTNHLDGEGRMIVAGVLQRWKGGALVVSRDADFLAAINVGRTLTLG